MLRKWYLGTAATLGTEAWKLAGVLGRTLGGDTNCLPSLGSGRSQLMGSMSPLPATEVLASAWLLPLPSAHLCPAGPLRHRYPSTLPGPFLHCHSLDTCHSLVSWLLWHSLLCTFRDGKLVKSKKYLLFILLPLGLKRDTLCSTRSS